jgi:F-type H+-transporting ATPase subunit epsilon
MATLTLRVITPNKIALDQQVESVIVPAVDGKLGILPRHAPMIAALDTGILEYREKMGGPKQALFVSGGFAEVHGETVRVVTEAGEKPAEIDEARAKEAEQRARERLANARNNAAAAGDPIDLLRAESALLRAVMRQRASEYHGA